MILREFYKSYKHYWKSQGNFECTIFLYLNLRCRQLTAVFQGMDFRARLTELEPSSASHWLCDLRQVTEPLWASSAHI